MIEDMGLAGLEVTDAHIHKVTIRLISGTAHVWVLGEANDARGFILTSLERDVLFGHRYLHIVGMRGVDQFHWTDYDLAQQALIEFAQRNECEAIIARIENQRLIALVQRYGAQPIPMYYKEV